MPVLYCHGFPSCRLEPSMLPVSGIRLIALDRPGYGLSDPLPGRTLLDWPRDVAAAADALGLGRFAVAGVSGGAPYAAACAALLKDRIIGLALICGIAPPGEGWEAGGAAAQLMMLDRLPGTVPLAAALGRRLVVGVDSAPAAARSAALRPPAAAGSRRSGGGYRHSGSGQLPGRAASGRRRRRLRCAPLCAALGFSTLATSPRRR